MIKSMTAYAKASASEESVTAEVTIRSYNSRYLDFAVHLPENCQAFEEEIKKIVGGIHQRGRMEIRLTVQEEAGESDLFEADTIRAASYYRALQKIQKTLGLADGPTLDQVLSAWNLIQPVKPELDQKILQQAVVSAVAAAARELDRMRCAEGQNLFDDLSDRIDRIEARMDLVRQKAGEVPAIYKKRLEDRLENLMAEGKGVDPVRLAQEVAFLADKSDVSEEIVRLHSHIRQFREVMAEENSQGRKLNFLIQEFNREFNTIGAKAGQADLSHMVVELKSELEKIREQVQNIE